MRIMRTIRMAWWIQQQQPWKYSKTSSRLLSNELWTLPFCNSQLCGVMGATEEESRPCPISFVVSESFISSAAIFSLTKDQSILAIKGRRISHIAVGPTIRSSRFISRAGIAIHLSYAIRCWAFSEDECPKCPKCWGNAWKNSWKNPVSLERVYYRPSLPRVLLWKSTSWISSSSMF